MANKITARTRFETLLTLGEVQAIDGMAAFIQNEIDKLDRKKAAGRTDALAGAKAELRDAIVAFMVPGKVYRVSEIMANVACPEGVNSSTSMFTSRLGELEKAGTVKRTVAKGVANYELA